MGGLYEGLMPDKVRLFFFHPVMVRLKERIWSKERVNMRSKGNSIVIFFVVAMLILSGCAGKMSLTPRSGGQSLSANYQDGMGQTTVNVDLPSGEKLEGELTWIPPGGNISTSILSSEEGSVTASGMSTGNKGMYVGNLVGEEGTNMRIELLCNTWTGKCVGVGETSDGVVYDIQK